MKRSGVSEEGRMTARDARGANVRDAQQVMDDVMEHIGGKRKLVDTIHANNGKQKDGYEYQTISNETRHELQKMFHADVELLEALLRRSFSWSWTNAANDTSWLTTHVPLTTSES